MVRGEYTAYSPQVLRRIFLVVRPLGAIIAAKDAVNMPWIYEAETWPNLTWDSEKLAPKLAAVRHQQGRLLGRMETLGFDLKQEATLTTLTSDVIKSSAIEGEHLNPEEVRSSIARRLGLDIGGLAPASRNVEGIVEMMLDATQRHGRPLTAARLFAWHAALFPTGRSGMLPITVGAWRPASAGPMQVVSGPYGRETVHYEAPIAETLEAEMAAFLAWFESDPEVDPVFRAGIAHLWFVTIHPFEDGNGRIARAIADMALARADGVLERYYSMSTQIEAERKDYYRELECQQQATVDITRWLDWFLGCLGRAIEGAEASLEAVLFKARFWARANQFPINERQHNVINRMLNGFKGHLNTSKYAKLAKCSPDTALRDIRALLDYGLIVKNPGGGRSTSYRLASIGELAESGSRD
jgi:Fic family protein